MFGEGQIDGSESIAGFVFRVLHVHVLVGVPVLCSRKAEAVRVAVVLVAVQLREQEVHTAVEQRQIGRVAEALERRPMAPQRQSTHHDRERCNLPQARRPH